MVEDMDRKVEAMRLATSSLTGQETSETVQSLDVSVQGMNRQRFTNNEISAMQTTSMLDLFYKDSKGDFRKNLTDAFAHGLKKGSCHSLDLAGKVPFSLLMLSIGVNHKELYVDSALSGGLYSQQMPSSPAVELFLRSRAQR